MLCVGGPRVLYKTAAWPMLQRCVWVLGCSTAYGFETDHDSTSRGNRFMARVAEGG